MGIEIVNIRAEKKRIVFVVVGCCGVGKDAGTGKGRDDRGVTEVDRIIAVGHMMNGPFFFAGTFKDEKAGGTVLQVGINIVLDSINLIRGRVEIINALAGKF